MPTPEDMFYEANLDDAGRDRFKRACQQLAGTVHSSLFMYLRIKDEAERVVHARENEPGHNVPLLMMDDFADTIDGVAVLIERGSGKNCRSLLRQAIELQVRIQFIHHDPAFTSRRSLAYHFWHIKDSLRRVLTVDDRTPEGQQFWSDAEEDPSYVQRATAKARADVDALVSERDGAEFEVVRQECERMRRVNRRPPKHWYQLWDGPATIETMAKLVTTSDIYDNFYREWSVAAHGSGALQRVYGKAGEAKSFKHHLRHPSGIGTAARSAFVSCFELASHLVGHDLQHRRTELFRHMLEVTDAVNPVFDRYRSLG